MAIYLFIMGAARRRVRGVCGVFRLVLSGAIKRETVSGRGRKALTRHGAASDHIIDRRAAGYGWSDLAVTVGVKTQFRRSVVVSC